MYKGRHYNAKKLEAKVGRGQVGGSELKCKPTLSKAAETEARVSTTDIFFSYSPKNAYSG